LDTLAPMQMTGVLERPSETAGASIVHLQHGIPTAGKKLGFPVEAPLLAWPDGAAMWMDDEGKVGPVRAVRNGEVTVDELPVPRRERDGFDRRHGALVQPLSIVHQEPGLSGIPVEQVELTGIAVAVDGHDDLAPI